MNTRCSRFGALSLALLTLAAGCAAEVGDPGDLDDVEARDVDEGLATSTSKRQIQYVVTAHPDDEFASWSLVEKSPANYPVFIVLTQGEETSYCAPGGEASLQEELGERTPIGDPYQGKWTAACKKARIGSWHRYLNAMAGFDDALSKPGVVGTFTGSGTAGSAAPSRDDGGKIVTSRRFKVYADSKSARVVFDLGDGDLRSEEVTWAIQQVRERRGQLFPLTKEYGVIAASYRNVDPACDVYDHTDHRAVHVAIHGTDQGTPGPQWGRTCISDPEVAAGRVDVVDEDTFEFAMGVDAPRVDPALYPDAHREGAFQRHYGWLRGSYWPAHGLEGKTHFGRKQAFWKRF